MPETIATTGGDDFRARRRPQDDPPTQFEVDTEKRLIAVRFFGKVTIRKIAEYAANLRAHPNFRPVFGELVDLREVREMDLQVYDFLGLADNIDPFSPDAKRAFVVRNTVQSHAARMHKVLRPKRNIEIFESLERAERWVRE